MGWGGWGVGGKVLLLLHMDGTNGGLTAGRGGGGLHWTGGHRAQGHMGVVSLHQSRAVNCCCCTILRCMGKGKGKGEKVVWSRWRR